MDGRVVSKKLKEEMSLQIKAILAEGQRAPHLVAILVGNDGASQTYVAAKEKACGEVGFRSTVLRFAAAISESELLHEIQKVNDDDEVDGLIVQLPIPKHISPDKVINQIDPKKDVDGFHPVNVGKMVQNLPGFVAATPLGILKMIEYYNISIRGKHCVIVGRSKTVGTPMSILLSRDSNTGDGTVTLCHSRTVDLESYTRSADILVVALGKPEFITGDMVKEGVVVIDVGITRVPSSTNKSGFLLKGDVKFDEVSPKCSFITPVPGGVGPMTIVALLQNTLSAYKNIIYA